MMRDTCLVVPIRDRNPQTMILSDVMFSRLVVPIRDRNYFLGGFDAKRPKVL